MASLDPPAGYTSAELVWDETFSSPSLDFTKWTGAVGQDPFDIYSWHGGLEPPYSALHLDGALIQNYFDPFPYANPVRVAASADGNTPHMAADTTGAHLVGGNGQLDIIACRASIHGSFRWSSGAISTYAKTHLPATGGYVQFSARMPDARYGAWAGLWFMADGDAAGGLEMDLHESGFISGDVPVNQILATHWWGHETQDFYDTGVDLSADFHRYGIEYNPGESWKIYFDGKLLHTYTDKVPNLRYSIIVDMDVADTGATGWHTQPDGVHDMFTMSIKSVQLYSLRPANSTGAPDVDVNLDIDIDIDADQKPVARG